MGRVYVHAVCPSRRRQFNLVLARALELRDKGEDPVVTYCGEERGTCLSNWMGEPLTCALCKLHVKRATAAAGLPSLAIDGDGANGANGATPYSVRKGLLTSVISTLVTQFRILAPDLDRIAPLRAIKRRYYRTAVRLHHGLERRIAELRPDRIEVVNGRHGCAHFGLIGARRHGIPFNTLEYAEGGRPIVFEGHTPHDRRAIQRRIRSQPADTALAGEYFERRRSRAHNRFADDHRGFDPPARAARYGRRVAIFLSSQDECESLGPDWQSPLRDHARTVEAVCERFPETFFCVRFHPHQASLLSDVRGPFRPLRRFENLETYFPEARVDSYDLIRWSDVVVAFNSTLSVEACWMGKPVIQLGPSFYNELGVGHAAYDVEGFVELLARDTLEPQPPENAARLAHYNVRDGDPLAALDTSDGRNRLSVDVGRSPVVLRLLGKLNRASRRAVRALFRLRR